MTTGKNYLLEEAYRNLAREKSRMEWIGALVAISFTCAVCCAIAIVITQVFGS